MELGGAKRSGGTFIPKWASRIITKRMVRRKLTKPNTHHPNQLAISPKITTASINMIPPIRVSLCPGMDL
jgi:hypothetical protein